MSMAYLLVDILNYEARLAPSSLRSLEISRRPSVTTGRGTAAVSPCRTRPHDYGR